METTVTMHTEDLSVFATVNRHPFIVGSTAGSTTTAPKAPTEPTATKWETKKVSTLNTHRQRILEMVSEHPGCTTMQIIKVLKGRPYNISLVVKEMVQTGELRAAGAGKNGNPYRHFLP